MPQYKVVEAGGTEKFIQAENLGEAIRRAQMPHSVEIAEECPKAPKHDFAPLTGLEKEGKTKFCRVCGLMM